MPTLSVAIFDSPTQAEYARKQCLDNNSMRKNFSKSVLVLRNEDNTIELHYMHRFAADGAAIGGVCGGVVGMLFLNPVLGALAGAGVGAVIGEIGDLGVKKSFIEKLANHLHPGSAAIFVPGKKSNIEDISCLLKENGGKIVSTILHVEDEQKVLEKIDMLQENIIKKMNDSSKVF